MPVLLAMGLGMELVAVPSSLLSFFMVSRSNRKKKTLRLSFCSNLRSGSLSL